MNNGVNNNLNTQQANGVVPQQPYNPTGNVPYNGQQVIPQQVNPTVQQGVVQQTIPQQPAVQPTTQPVVQPSITTSVSQPVTVQQDTSLNVPISTAETVTDEQNNPGYNIVPPIEGSIDGGLASKLKKAEEERDKALADLKKAEEDKSIAEDAKKEALEELNAANTGKKKKSGGGFAFILLLICLGLGGYIYYSSNSHKAQIEKLNYNCTPVLASKEETKLDVNSTLVKSLYSKVETNIREDIAQPEFNDNMKLYLAYRQVLDSDKYDSNCNLYSATSMEPLVCDPNDSSFVPKTFKPDKLVVAYKKLFGENSTFELKNIQLGRSCIGGYQYIEGRDEYVQGHCTQQNSTFYTVTKKVVEATSSRNRVVLKEEVKYNQSEGVELPAYLKSGYYYYLFRLDLDYNYVLVSKTYESKY